MEDSDEGIMYYELCSIIWEILLRSTEDEIFLIILFYLFLLYVFFQITVHRKLSSYNAWLNNLHDNIKLY